MITFGSIICCMSSLKIESSSDEIWLSQRLLKYLTSLSSFITVMLSNVGSSREVKVGLMRAAGRKGKAIRFLIKILTCGLSLNS